MARIEYLDQTIVLNEKTGEFTIEDDEDKKPYKTLPEAQAEIRARTKVRKFPRVQVYKSYWGQVPQLITITSLTRNGAWAVAPDGRREKLFGHGRLFEKSPKNDASVARIVDIDSQIRALDNKRAELMKNLTAWNPTKEQYEASGVTPRQGIKL